MRIGANGWPQATTAQSAPRPDQAFRLRPRAAATAACPAAALPAGLLALNANMPSARDAVARRRGRAMLGGLDTLQRAMLGGGPEGPALRSLAGLVDGEDGEDAEIAEALRALALRARIELVRRERDQDRSVTTPR